MAAKIEHELGSGETYLVYEDGRRERVVCYDLKFQLGKSESRIYYWPKKKSDRKKARDHFDGTGEVLDLNNE